MSIASAIAAERANTQKEKWVKELQEAVDADDMEAVEALLGKMKNHWEEE